MSLTPKDPEEAYRKQREWRRRSAEKYEQRLREEGGSRFRDLGHNQGRRKESRERDFGEKADMIREQPCDTCGAPPPSEASHYPSRGAGGTSENLLPQCRACHRCMHRAGVETFLASIGKSLAWLVERTEHWEGEWQRRRPDNTD